jgi:HK97 family phage portal protein
VSTPSLPPPGRSLYGGLVRDERGPGISVYTGTDGRDMLVNDPDGWEVSRPHLWWEGPAGGDGTGGPVGNPPRAAADPLAGRLPAAVTRCTSLLADTLAGMPWRVLRDRVRLPVPDWVADPQAKRRDLRISAGPVPEWRRSGMEFWSWTLTSMLWEGEGCIYVPNRNDDGTPAPPLWQLNPRDIEIDGGEYVIPPAGSSEGYRFAPGELIVIRGLVRGGPRGVGVLRAHFHDLALAGEIGTFAFNMLRRGVPSGYLKVTAPALTRDKARELSSDWMRQHGGTLKRIAVLNSTTEFHPLQLDPQAMQLAQMRDYSTLDLALIFGIPPYMLGLAADNSTYANVESRMIEFAQFSLLPWARRAESALDAEFPRGTSLKINLDALRRADTETRYKAHKIGLDAKFLTVEEVRDMEDLPPMGEAEEG